MRKALVGAVFAVISVVGATLPADANVTGFSDVRGSEFYAAAVAWMSDTGLTTGVGGTGEYQPGGAITRAQMATFLWRLDGQPTGNPAHGFVDVPSAAYYSEAVRWLRATGLTTGVGGSNAFAPDAVLTRAQMATFLWRYAGESQGNPGHGFVDVPAGIYYDQAVRWLKANGITTGVGGTNRFEPDSALNRGQMATFIWRYEGAPAPSNPGDTKNCSSFSSREDAQAWFDLYRPYFGDVALLDTDNGNGRACESHVYAPPPPTGPQNPGDTKNCSDFPTWSEAQNWFNYYFPYYGDIAKLDGNNDGIACESLR